MNKNLSTIFSALLILFGSYQAFGNSSPPVSAKRFQVLSGVAMPGRSNPEKMAWDKTYSSDQYVFGKAPAPFLAKNYQYIPKGANVLDMGMGEGRNAVFLAQKGYKVTGVDISSVAVKKSLNLARELDVRINAIVASLNQQKFPDNSFDAIIVYYYVDRSLIEKIRKWLKPNGVLIFEAHTYNQKKVKGHERYKVEHLLAPGELLKLFPGMSVLKYEEPLHEKEFRASIIVQN